MLILSGFSAQAEKSDLNLDFIRGGAKGNIPTILLATEKYPEGQYVVDIKFNREGLGRQVLMVSPQEADELCLSTEWIAAAALPIKLAEFAPYFDQQRQCYILGRFPGAKITLNTGMQTLTFSIPQIAVLDKLAAENWDYGIPGFRLTYYGNARKSSYDNKTQFYGNVELNANLGRWVLAGQTSTYSGQGFSTPDARLYTAIAPIRGNLILGKTQTASTLLPDFGFYGAALRSDSSMVPWSQRGYSPVISGVANSNARITITQGSYTLHNQIVPPGAYSLRDITPIGNGDLTVTVEEENGEKTVRTYPVTTLPTLLRSGDFNYNLVVGTRTDGTRRHRDVKGLFTLASLDYGFEPFTLNTALILHKDYQSLGLGLTRDFGLLGALSVSVNGARSVFDNSNSPYSYYSSSYYRDSYYRDSYFPNSYSPGADFPGTGFPDIYKKDNPSTTQMGFSARVKYAKGLTEKTNLQLMSYHYTGEKYVDFAEFNPTYRYPDNRKARYEGTLTHNFDNSYVSLSGWAQTYRQHRRSDIGANLGISTSIKRVFLNLNANYSKYYYFDRGNYGASFSVSIPFSAFGQDYYSNSSVNYNRDGNTTFNTGFSGRFNERVNYNLNSSLNRDSKSISAYTGVAFDAVQTNFSASQSSSAYSSNSTLSASVSGSVIGTVPTGLLFAREQSSTVAVVNLKGIPGVRFNNSQPTNSQGNTVLYVSPYSNNSIRINTEQVPENVELLNTVYSVVPTERAIVYREFGHTEIHRYILRVVGRDGKPLPLGSSARTEKDVYAGFVADGGILLVNVTESPASITVQQQNGQQCRFSMQGIVAGENKAKEVHCE
jgi:outer membrane usher protein FimD/PapC